MEGMWDVVSGRNEVDEEEEEQGEEGRAAHRGRDDMKPFHLVSRERLLCSIAFPG
jgi:hypothetical protein